MILEDKSEAINQRKIDNAMLKSCGMSVIHNSIRKL